MSNQQEEINVAQTLEAYWMKICQSVCTYLMVEDKEVSIAFVDNETIKALNTSYRDKPAVTDVLSFPLSEPTSSEPILGEIVISLPRAQAQAEALGHDLKREVVFLLIHGLLHLVGYDHDETHSGEMRQKEKEIFDTLSLPIQDN